MNGKSLDFDNIIKESEDAVKSIQKALKDKSINKTGISNRTNYSIANNNKHTIKKFNQIQKNVFPESQEYKTPFANITRQKNIKTLKQNNRYQDLKEDSIISESSNRSLINRNNIPDQYYKHSEAISSFSSQQISSTIEIKTKKTCKDYFRNLCNKSKLNTVRDSIEMQQSKHAAVPNM